MLLDVTIGTVHSHAGQKIPRLFVQTNGEMEKENRLFIFPYQTIASLKAWQEKRIKLFEQFDVPCAALGRKDYLR